MTAERTNHEKVKCDLNTELETVLKAAGGLAAGLSSHEFLPSEITQNLCNVVEAIFIHGLRDPFFLKGSRYSKYPEPNFWPFVSKYSHKSITNQINDLNMIKSEIGKSRAWIRIILNESSLEHYLQLLLREKKAMQQFYNDWAYLRDLEQVDRMTGFVKSLSPIPIKAAINSSFLNSWTPSPLILAGLSSGKVVKIKALPKKQSVVAGPSNGTEAGISALDYLPTAVHQLSPIRPLRNGPIQVGTFSDDDASSVYSHPSMLDQTERRVLSSTPNNDSFITTQMAGPLIVSRRTKRPRRSSKSSSESNSKGSNKHSETCTSRSALESAPSSLPASLPVKCLLDDPVILEGEPLNNFSPTKAVDKGEMPSEREEKESRMEEEEVETVNGSDSTRSTTSEEKPTETDDVVMGSGESRPESSSSQEEHQETVTEEVKEEETEEPQPETSEVKIEESKEEDTAVESSPETAAGLHPSDSSGSDILEKVEDIETCGLEISPNSNNEDSMLGTSLHDELMSALSFETTPGNALNSSGAWAVPRSNCWENDGDTSGILSSSSGSSGAPVSFGQALRSAMEQHSPTEEEMAGFGESPDEAELLEKKKAQEVDIDHRLTTVATEAGLAGQEFRCPMCRKSIGPVFNFGKFELCGVDGFYYCLDCMKGGGTYTIPARVLHSWDWTPRQVSDRGRAFIEANLERPSFNMALSPKLYDHIPALRNILRLRERLQIVSLYLFNCRESVAEDFRKRVHPRDYLYNDIHTYSFMDLQNVRTGNLEKQLNAWLKHGVGHVMSCVLCRQKGFICEICNKREVIYPFNTATTRRCPECFSVHHRECSESAECPKCVRRHSYEVKPCDTALPLD